MTEQVKINYPANSHKAKSDEKTIEEEVAKEEKKKVESVVTGKVTLRKPSLGKRIAESFTGDDAQSVGEYIVFDVLIPGARDMLFSAFTQGLERKLYGEVRSRPITSKPGNNTYRPSYSSYSTKPSRDPRSSAVPESRRARPGQIMDDVVLETRIEAEEVLDGMGNLIDTYGSCTISDLKDLLEISGNHVDDKWGWYDLRGADVRYIRSGYLLDLPRPEPIQ